MIKSNLAPIVLFVFNRPEHTKLTLDALAENELAGESELFIFSDGPRSNKDLININSVKTVIEDESYNAKFKSINISFSIRNKGLANSVKDGVSEVIGYYGKVIVLEDDLVTSKDFLVYMNSTLNEYENNDEVGAITGYNPLTTIPINYQYDVYFSPRTCSLGWGTYQNVWRNIDWRASTYKNFKKSYKKRLLFNRTGFDRAKRLDKQINKGNNSWSIIFGFDLFMNSKLFVYPINSKLKHIGWDGSGTHKTAGTSKFNDSLILSTYPLNYPQNFQFDRDLIKKTSNLYGNSMKAKISDLISFLRYYYA